MKRYCLAIIFFLFSVILVTGQSREKAAQLIGRLDTNGDDSRELSDNIALKTRGLFNTENDYIAIRACSNEPLPIIFAFSNVNLFFESLRYNSFDIPKSRIYYLRQNKSCRFQSRSILTEYWIVPKNAEFPEFVEIRNAEDIMAETIFSGIVFDKDEESKASKDWVGVKSNSLEAMKKHRTALMLIETPLRRRSRIYPKAVEIKNFLVKNGIGKNRIFIKERFSLSSRESYPKEKYPTITLAHQK